MSDKPAVEQLISEALVHWQSTVKRCVNRSHPGVAGRKKKEKFTMPLSDLLEAQALEAQNFSGRVGLSLDDDDDDDDNVEKDDAEQEQTEAGKAGASLEEPEALPTAPRPSRLARRTDRTACRRDGRSSVCQTLPPASWSSLPSRNGGRISGSRTFSMTDGTRAPTKQMLQGKVHWDFYYHSMDKSRYVHSLLPEEHGLTKSWVVIAKSK